MWCSIFSETVKWDCGNILIHWQFGNEASGEWSWQVKESCIFRMYLGWMNHILKSRHIYPINTVMRVHRLPTWLANNGRVISLVQDWRLEKSSGQTENQLWESLERCSNCNLFTKIQTTERHFPPKRRSLTPSREGKKALLTRFFMRFQWNVCPFL